MSFRASVIAAHMLTCDHIVDFDEHRVKMFEEMSNAISKIISDMDNEMEACLAEKAKFQIFEHVCGPNRVSNFRNALLYIKVLLVVTVKLKRRTGKIA